MRNRAIVAAVMAVLTLGALGASPAGAQGCRGADVVPSAGRATQARAAIRCLVNHERTSRGVRPLADERRLRRAASRFAVRMVRQRFFAHVAPDGRTLLQRLRSTRYVSVKVRRYAIAENLGFGTGRLGTPRAIVAGWMHSPDHRHNMLDPRFRQVGIGMAAGSPFGDHDARTVVADFGLRVR